MLPAPFSWTISAPLSAFGTRWRLTALIVEPHATPSVMFESKNRPRSRAADIATRSRRSTSLVWSGIGTRWTATPNRSRITAARCSADSAGEWIWMSTSPVSRAWLSSRETEEREVCSSRAIASIVRSCM